MTSITPPTSSRHSRTLSAPFLLCGTWQMYSSLFTCLVPVVDRPAPIARVSKYDEYAEGLAWRAFDILDIISNVSGGGAAPISPQAMHEAIKTFVGLLQEISAAMEQEQNHESGGLAQFVERLYHL
ncbi:hypothetical protein B0H16DRAFT_1720127 [Mycena metata]|uniref:Uncharacterized protein n=1 Tax=Mycena metata TaxID=1033252 RepID=A0AAD7NGJ5_9AGAR|nr:hypothetical protein B0H16DRAFT_1720127 [Mycena metata]